MKLPPRSLDVPRPEATALRPVRLCAGRVGAAGLSPQGAISTFGTAGRYWKLPPQGAISTFGTAGRYWKLPPQGAISTFGTAGRY